MHDDTFLHVTRFQFVQDTPGRSVLRIVPGTGFSAADAERVLRNLRRKLNGRVELSVEIAQSLPVSPRGKTIYVDQQITAAKNPASRIA